MFRFVPSSSVRVVVNTVKGRDERPAGPLDRVHHHSRRFVADTRTAATSALTFMTFS